MIRLTALAVSLMLSVPGAPLFAQEGGVQPSRFQAWVGGTGGVGSGGMAGRGALVLSASDWTLTGRYVKTMSGGGGRHEVYREDVGLLLGRVVRREWGQSSFSVGAGRVSNWDDNYVSCPDCWLADERRVGGTRADSFGGLLEVSYYPGANGGMFGWGFTLFGAVAPAGSHLSAGITLGLGRTP